MMTTTATRTDRSTSTTRPAGAGTVGEAPRGAGRRSADVTRVWAPVWVRAAGAAPAALRGRPSAAAAGPAGPRSGGTSTAEAPTGVPARLDEATRRLLRVPSLVAETAQRRLGHTPSGDDATNRTARRRPRRTHGRRPPSGLIAATPAWGGPSSCEFAPRPAAAPAYRMSRRARLTLTVTVFAAAVLVAAHALLSGGPTATTEVTVTAGDTLWTIAQQAAPDDEVWSVIDEITALNGLTGTDVVPGQVLTVPVG